MNTVIRRGVFETNSSSVHTLSIFNQEDWDAYCKDTCGYIMKKIVNPYERKFYNNIMDIPSYVKWCSDNDKDPSDDDSEWEWRDDEGDGETMYVDSGFGPTTISTGTLFEEEEDGCCNICETIKVDTSNGPLYILLGNRMN